MIRIKNWTTELSSNIDGQVNRVLVEDIHGFGIDLSAKNAHFNPHINAWTVRRRRCWPP